MPQVLLIATGEVIAYSGQGLLKAADLARRVRAAVLDDGYDGAVVTHGLDTRCRTGGSAVPDQPAGHGLATGVGAISARGLVARKARLALMVALGSGTIAGVRRWFGAI